MIGSKLQDWDKRQEEEEEEKEEKKIDKEEGMEDSDMAEIYLLSSLTIHISHVIIIMMTLLCLCMYRTTFTPKKIHDD